VRTDLRQRLGPHDHELLLAKPERAAKFLRGAVSNPKAPTYRSLLRVAALLGPSVTGWLDSQWRARWGSHTQPPEWFQTLGRMLRRTGISDRRLLALRTTALAKLILDDGRSVSVGDLLSNPTETARLLSSCCRSVTAGNKELRAVCRDLDILAYGKDLEAKGELLAAALLMES
jgi:hypothetical protein